MIENPSMKNPTIRDVVKGMRERAGALTVGGVVLLATATWGLAGDDIPAPKDLGTYYQQNCARCHGATGNARDAAGKSLRGADFTDPKWQKDSNDAAMAKVILKGKFFGLAMPAFKDSLSQEEALRLVREVLHKLPGTQPK